MRNLRYNFGVTIFPKLRCAVAPLPVFISYDEYINNIKFVKNIDDIFSQYSHIDFSKTNFKGLVIANDKKVTDLIYYFQLLKEHPKLEDYII